MTSMNDEALEVFLASLAAYHHAHQVPCISDDTAAYLRYLLRLHKPRHVLEVGTCHGYSSLQMMRELRAWKGEITSIEYSAPSYDNAINNLTQAGFADEVHVQFGDALMLLPMLPNNSFDFAFIDAEKRNTLAFVQRAWPKLRIGSVMVIDDVLKYRAKMADFWQWLEDEQLSHQVVGIDRDDGLMVLVKQ